MHLGRSADQLGGGAELVVPVDVEHAGRRLAVGETVILLHLPLPLVGVSIWMQRECQQNTVSPMASVAVVMVDSPETYEVVALTGPAATCMARGLPRMCSRSWAKPGGPRTSWTDRFTMGCSRQDVLFNRGSTIDGAPSSL